MQDCESKQVVNLNNQVREINTVNKYSHNAASLCCLRGKKASHRDDGEGTGLSNGLKDSPGCEQLTTKDMKTVLGVVSCNAEST